LQLFYVAIGYEASNFETGVCFYSFVAMLIYKNILLFISSSLLFDRFSVAI